MNSALCPSCNYDLRAQVTQWGARCPECGCGFTTEELERPRGWLWRSIVVPLAAITIPPLIFIALIWIGISRWYENWPFWHSAVMISVLVATPVAHQVLAMNWCRRQNWPYLLGSFIGIALTLTAVGVFYLLGFAIVSILLSVFYGR